jgi:hypothetical protein
MNTHLLKPVAFVGPAAAETIQKLYALEQRFLRASNRSAFSARS